MAEERHSPSSAPNERSQETTPSALPKKRSKWLRWFAWSFATLMLLALLAAGTAWWWIGQSASLAQTISRVALLLPQDQSLQARDVEGTVRHGGKIGWLRWSSPTLQLEMEQAKIGWSLRPLLSLKLQLGQFHVDTVRIRSTPQPDKSEPTEPMESLTLPVQIDLPFEVNHLIWEGPPEVLATDLKGRYQYTGSHHELAVDSVRWADGEYAAKLSLQGAAPMAMETELRGLVQAQLPDTDRSFTAQAQASIIGNLSGENAKLDIVAKAQAQPIDGESKATNTANTPSDEVLAEISATIFPWKTQPIDKAHVHLQQVNVEMFWPQGPRTILNGTADVTPAENGWNVGANIRNSIPGPWDKQSLPIQELTATAQQQGSEWHLLDSVIDTGKGRITAKAVYDTESSGLEGKLQLDNMNPAALWSTLDPTPLQGQIQAITTASSDTDNRIEFDANIQASTSAKRSSNSALRIDSLTSKGQWQAPLLQISALHLKALGADISADTVQFNADTLATQANARARIPGMDAAVQGAMAPDTGEGKLTINLSSGPQLLKWLRQLPGQSKLAQGMEIEGSADAALHWQGGWSGISKRLAAASASSNARPPASHLQVQTKVNSSALGWKSIETENAATRLENLSLHLQGSPENFTVQLKSNALLGVQKMMLDTALQGGLLTVAGAAPLDWQARIEKLTAQWQSNANSGIWKADLQSPVTMSQRLQGRTVQRQRIDASAGALRVQSPASGNSSAGIDWQPVLLQEGHSGQWQIQSQGKLQGIPLAWVDAFSANPQTAPLASAGISGDLALQGQWNINTLGDTPVADLLIERASGDVRLALAQEDTDANITVVRSAGAVARRADGSVQQPTVPGRGMRARINQLRVQIRTQGTSLRADLLWDSERAGKLQASVNSQLQNSKEGWQWPENAPLQGQASISLPDVGIWAMFAPPGWRVNGQLQGDVQIAGTRSQPQWNGNIAADNISLSSLLDGLDLNNGRLRARLQGTRLDITELSLQGGRGSTARILGYSGNLTAAPQDGGRLTGSGFAAWEPDSDGSGSGMRMDIQLQADKLQVLVRADRQLSASGNLSAKLEKGQLILRGDINVDRAAILLPDESAPSLDKDVVVHSAATRKAEEEQRKKDAATTKAGATPDTAKPPDMLINLNLGRDFALQGYGIITRLRGQLQIRGAQSLSAPPSITGEVRTEQGRYRAWGQSLDVETGLIRFNGPYDNPSLDITAIRPNIAVRAGVKVTGSATSPRVTLFSDPEMSDAEKLSWIVMGRDTSNGGAEAALLQQAALALLSGGGTGENFAGRLGLDEIGFKGPDSNSSDPDAGAALTLGKRLSKDLYVTYEQSLNGAMGTLYVFYEFSRRLTLRGQTGQQTAVDLIYTMRKD